MLKNARARAKKRGVPCTLTVAWIEAKLREGLCEVSGCKLSMTNRSSAGPMSPSLDRIDPDMGYTPDNSRMVGFMFNCAFGNWGEAKTIPLLLRYLKLALVRFPALPPHISKMLGDQYGS